VPVVGIETILTGRIFDALLKAIKAKQPLLLGEKDLCSGKEDAP